METASSAPSTTIPRTPIAIVAAWVLLCAIWGSTWLAIKIGLADLPPISFTGLRFVIAAAVLFAISFRRFPLPQREDYSLIAFTGILMFAINYALLFWGEQYVSSGLAAILQATIPTFGLVFAHFYLPSERLKWERIAGALLALGGVTIICAKLLDFQGVMAFWGGVAIVIGAAAASYSNILVKARGKKFEPSMIAAWQMLFALPPLLLIGFFHEGNPLHFHWSKTAIACLLYLSLVGSVAAFLLFYWLMNRVAVTNLLTISLITPPLAVAIGWFVAGETLSRWAILGAVFVLAGIALILWKSKTPTGKEVIAAETA
jgi:drug/metabolite transporter (DMT)-like permease